MNSIEKLKRVSGHLGAQNFVKAFQIFIYIVQIAVAVFLYLLLSGHIFSGLFNGHFSNASTEVFRYLFITAMILIIVIICILQMRKGGPTMILPLAFLITGAACYRHQQVDEMILYSIAYIIVGVINVLLNNLPINNKIQEA